MFHLQKCFLFLSIIPFEQLDTYSNDTGGQLLIKPSWKSLADGLMSFVAQSDMIFIYVGT